MLALTSAQWDITDPGRREIIVGRRRGDQLRGLHHVDAAERDQEAHTRSTPQARHLARACARVGARLIHLSTDYVFSGHFGDEPPRPYEIDDATRPLSVYGRTKLAGERAVHAALPDALWCARHGCTRADGKDFVATMRTAGGRRRVVDVVADQIGSPTYVADLVGALLEVADGEVTRRCLHAANAGAVSRFEQARAVFEAGRRPRPGTAGDSDAQSAAGPAAGVFGAVESESRRPGSRRCGRGTTRWRMALAAAQLRRLTDTLYA